MLQKSKSKSIAKAKYIVLLPLIMVMLTYVACSEDKTVEEEKISSIKELGDDSLRARYKEQIRLMEEGGSSEQDIQDAFFMTLSEVKSREDFYKTHTYLIYLENKDLERKKAKENHNDKIKNMFFNDFENLTYEEFLARKISQNNGVKYSEEFAKRGDIPFAVIEQVPVFPGCENLGSNEEQKKCMTEKITEYVNKNFNTGLGKELNLSGVNRIIVQFKIDKQGNIVEVRSRAPHPDLEVEAERVINSLPSMKPGEQEGIEVGVMYSLPIVFQVGE